MSNEFIHSGIKGMKWGVRNYQNKDGSLTKAGRARHAKIEDKFKSNKEKAAELEKKAKEMAKRKLTAKKEEASEKKQKAIEEAERKRKEKEEADYQKELTMKKSVKQMSTRELNDRISRLKLEKEYRDLTNSSRSNGQKFVMSVLESIGKNTLTNIGSQAATHIIGNAVNKLAGVDSTDVVKRLVNPQKGQSDKK